MELMLYVFKSTAFGGDGGTALATSDFFSTIDFSTPYTSEIIGFQLLIILPSTQQQIQTYKIIMLLFVL
jgi:hypothetical protein